MRRLAELLCRLRAQILPGLQKLLNNNADAEDILQEALLDIFVAITTFRGDARLLTWAWTVARNAALNWIRDEANRRKLLEAHATITSEIPGMGEQTKNPESAALFQERLLKLQRGYDNLTERERDLVRESAMRYLEGRDRDGSPSPSTDSTLRMVLFRARGKLRALLEGGEEKS